MTPSRGYRNNNPGNLRKGGKPFLGEVKDSTDIDFRQFEKMEYGYRAMFKLLQNYRSMGVDTIAKIINRYAPTNENNTEAYISAVERSLGIGRDKVLNLSNSLIFTGLVAAIAKHENGTAPNMAQVQAGYQLLTVASLPEKKKIV